MLKKTFSPSPDCQLKAVSKVGKDKTGKVDKLKKIAKKNAMSHKLGKLMFWRR